MQLHCCYWNAYLHGKNMKNDNHNIIVYHNDMQYIMMLCSVLTVLYMLHDSNGVSLKAV